MSLSKWESLCLLGISKLLSFQGGLHVLLKWWSFLWSFPTWGRSHWRGAGRSSSLGELYSKRQNILQEGSFLRWTNRLKISRIMYSPFRCFISGTSYNTFTWRKIILKIFCYSIEIKLYRKLNCKLFLCTARASTCVWGMWKLCNTHFG